MLAQPVVGRLAERMLQRGAIRLRKFDPDAQALLVAAHEHEGLGLYFDRGFAPGTILAGLGKGESVAANFSSECGVIGFLGCHDEGMASPAGFEPALPP